MKTKWKVVICISAIIAHVVTAYVVYPFIEYETVDDFFGWDRSDNEPKIEYVDRIEYINNTEYVDTIHYVDKIEYVDRVVYIDQPRTNINSVKVTIKKADCNHDTDEGDTGTSRYPDLFVGVTVYDITEYTTTMNNDRDPYFGWFKTFIAHEITDIYIELYDEDANDNELIGNFVADPGNVTDRMYRGDGWSVTYSVSYKYE